MSIKQTKNWANGRRYIDFWVFLPVHNAGLFRLMVTVAVVFAILPWRAGTAADWRSNWPVCTSQGCTPQPATSRTIPHHLIAVRATTGTHIGPWHLVRTPAPDNKETVSVMRTGELLKSDPDFAGLMIKCRERAGLQIGFVVISPFPPKSQPRVTVSTGTNSLHFKASVIAPGTIVVLPNEANALIQGPWQNAKRLTVEIKGDQADIHGTVSLKQLSGAVALLQANCPAP